jgi:competence protein ComEC
MKNVIASLIGILIAITCVIRTAHVPSSNTIDWYADGSHVEIHGKVADEPDRRPMQTKYTVEVYQLIDGSGTILDGVTGRALITDRRQWPEYEYGDHVIVRGALEKPEQIDTFHYDRYLSRFDIYSVIYRGSIKTDPTPYALPPMPYKRTLYTLKSNFEAQINRLLPEPHASFMAGILTGSRRGIPDDLMADFNITGLTHIIAISGYNITIVIAIIGNLLFWLPLKVRFIPATVAIIAFTVFVGASAAVVRAAIMGILGLAALQLGRVSHVRLSLLWTAFLMVAWNPKLLWYDAGFQLSFLAVIGLIELAPLLNKLFKRVPHVLAIRESMQMTVAAQIAAAPVIALLFDRLSLIAPLANLLIAPVLPLAMLFGALGTLISFVSLPLGLLIMYGGWTCLQWIIWIAKLCAALPFASVHITISPLIIIGYYSILITALLFTTYTNEAPSSHGATLPATS